MITRLSFRRTFFAWVFLLSAIATGCEMLPSEKKMATTLFIGVDASGSFKHSGYYNNALKFLARYIYGHMNEIGGLVTPRALFVGSVGGKKHDEPKTFHPIHDFKGKSIKEIEKDLKTWFKPNDTLTDFNSFFEEVARITKERNLILAPITMMVVSDGIPDFSKKSGGNKGKGLYSKINLKPLEHLSRNITLRLTYVSPVVAKKWRTQVPRNRVQLWTVDGEVMKRWPKYMKPGVDFAKQAEFWEWLRDNVDYPIRGSKV